MSELEKVMEQKLITQLTQGKSQWTLREDLRTEDDLWNNLRKILERNNVAILKGHPITDNEMESIKDFIRDIGKTPYDAAVWLSGENGEAQIPLLRDDASLGKVYLMAVDNREIAGGRSVYEVIHQYQAAKRSDDDKRSRRFDVSLLINGLPLIHIELKNTAHPYMDAFRQIVKYSQEDKFSGIFGLVQMFVVSNGTETRYIAAATADKLNAQFLTKWVDEHNKPQDNYLDFAKGALNIPRAHEMIGRYSVIDDDKKQVLLLRPYQIHAVQKVKQASCERKSGYVWHTTGSGKTLTSFNVTRNLLDIPTINKAIFLIDRRDLDQQTTRSFQSYAEHSPIKIDATANTKALISRLKSNDKAAIVTTVQKMQSLLRWCQNDPDSEVNPNADDTAALSKSQQKREKLKQRLKELQIAFVVDECHRAVSGKTKRLIEKFFDQPMRPSLWYGFTGTPIFAENKKTAVGSLPQTTEAQYGPCLHSYTVKEAIKDKAVLGFQLQHYGFDRAYFEELAKGLQITVYDQLSDDELEKHVVQAYEKFYGRSLYDTDEHREEVIDYIINRCAAKFNLRRAPAGQSYGAILTCSSIKDAQHYYELITQFKADGKVAEAILKLAPDFPKVAITYSVAEDAGGALANQAKMQAALQDYNAMFGTAFSLEGGMQAYSADLNLRLARKHSKYHDRKEQLDLVIVVDRLLTGFDAPCISTLFIDRPPMSPQGLVQAISRTNRLFDQGKQYGQIVTFQTPALFKNKIDRALYLYSRGGTADVSAPSFIAVSEQLRQAVAKLRAIAPKPEDVAELHERPEKTAFVKAFQELDKALKAIATYDEFDASKLAEDYGISDAEIDEYAGRYQNVLDELKQPVDPDDPEPLPDLDVDYELMSISQETVNYDYLIALIQKYVPHDGGMQHAAPVQDPRVDELIGELGTHNPKLAAVVDSVWKKLQANPTAFTNLSIAKIVSSLANNQATSEIEEFAKRWGMNEQELIFLALSQNPDDVNNLNFDYEAYKAAGGSLSKLQARRTMRAEAVKFAKEELRPLLLQGRY